MVPAPREPGIKNYILFFIIIMMKRDMKKQLKTHRVKNMLCRETILKIVTIYKRQIEYCCINTYEIDI